jgi:hypothetical protein
MTIRLLNRPGQMGRRWESTEDDQLKALFEKYGRRWGVIASHMENRSATQVVARWEKCLNPSLCKGSFTPEEDQMIIEHVSIHGPCHWPILCKALENRRSPKQCRERWSNHLNPDLNTNSWTAAEDQILLSEYGRIGPRWVTIAQVLPGRSDNAVKNRWNTTLKSRFTVPGEAKKVRMRPVLEPVITIPPRIAPPLRISQYLAPLLKPRSTQEEGKEEQPLVSEQIKIGPSPPITTGSPFYLSGCSPVTTGMAWETPLSGNSNTHDPNPRGFRA